MSKKLISVFIVTAVVLFVILIRSSFAATQMLYPQLNISGHKHWYYNKLEISPARNYLLALDNILYQSQATGPWTEQLSLYIQGKLLVDLGVNYDLWQLSGSPSKYNVFVSYKDYYLSLGNQEELFADQEFAVQDLLLNGGSIGLTWDKLKIAYFASRYPNQEPVRLTTNHESWKLFRNPDYDGDIAATSYYKDNPDLEYLGLDLGRIDIVEESVAVRLDGKELIKGEEFMVDADGGLVLIPRSFQGAEEVEVRYRLINGKKENRNFDFQKEAKRRAFSSPEYRIIDDSEILTVDGLRLYRDIDYRANYILGLFILAEPVASDASVRIDYSYTYGPYLYESEKITGQTGIVFNLKHSFLATDREQVLKNGQYLNCGIDYLIDYTAGRLSLNTLLTSSDTLEVTYFYRVNNQAVSGYVCEYQLTPWSKWGASSVSLRDVDFADYNDIPAADFDIINIYNTTIFNENTLIKTELALSNRDIISSGTREPDSALSITGKTQLGNCFLSSTYRRNGLYFTTIGKVKSNTNSAKDKVELAIKYPFHRDSFVKIGFENFNRQWLDLVSPEAKDQIVSLEFKYNCFDIWDFGYMYKAKTQDVPDLQFSGKSSAQSLYNNFNILNIAPVSREYCQELQLILKALQNNEKGRVNDPVVLVNSDTRYDKNSLGTLMKFKGGLSSYVLLTNEIYNDLNNSSLSYDRNIPYFKLAYKWELAGHDFELYYDCSQAQQRGAVNCNKTEQGYGFVLQYPVNNPVLSEFQFGADLKNIHYEDVDDSANDYVASQVGVRGSLIF